MTATESQTRGIYGYAAEISATTTALTCPESRGAVIVGAAGAGKTTVMNAALAGLDPRATILRFRGSSQLASRNLGIFEIFLSRSGYSSDLSPGMALSVIARSIKARTEGSVPVALVDNAGRVDPHSLSVLSQLAEAGLIRVLAAMESIRPPLDLLAGLWLAGLITRVDLTGIDKESLAAMVRDTDPSASPYLINELHRRTQGNPQMLKDLLAGRTKLGAQERVLWSIDPRHHRLLEMIAVVGALPYDSLIRLSEPGDLDALAEHGIVRMTRERHPAVTIVEPVVAETLRTGLRPAQALQLWKDITRIVDIDTVEGRVLFGLVTWGQSLGIRIPAERVLAAGSWANSAWMYAEAAQLLRNAETLNRKIKLELARAERGRGDFATAKRITDHLVETAREEEASEVELSRLACIELRLTDPREPEKLGASWVRERLSTAAELGRLDVTRARFDLKGGRIAAGRDLAEGVYRDRACATRHRLRACALLGVAEVMRGRTRVGLEYLAQAEVMFELPGMTSFEIEDAVPQFFLGRYIAGDWEEARHALRWMPKAPQLAEITAALIDIRTGHVARAHQVLERQRRDAKMLEMVDPTRVTQAARLLAEALLGRTTHSSAPSPPLPPPPVDSGFGAYTWWEDIESQLFELQTLALTRPDRAAGMLWELGLRTERAGAHALTAYAWIDATRYGHRGAVEALPGVAAQVDGALGRFAETIALAFATDDHADLIEAARESLAFGAVSVCSDLAKLARTRAIERDDAKGVKQARILMETSLRTMRFNTPGARLPDVLTDVERQLVDGVMAGTSSAQLGAELHLSPRTVEWHLSRIYRRLHVSNRQELRDVVRTWRRK